MPFDTPVVLFFFNRPKHLERVFARVREVQPRDLLLVADGPRSGRPDEAEICEQTRAVVADVDWPCRVVRCYADENMGCRDRIASGIREAFARFESAIFLEDDCLPELSFFPYCKALLDHYHGDQDVAFISGTRFIRLPAPEGLVSYQFCSMPLVWGWASWRRAWEGYDEMMQGWPEDEAAIRVKLKQIAQPLGPTVSERVVNSVVSAMSNCHNKLLNTWDQPLAYHLLKRDLKCIIPRTNMVTNLGFGALSTHSATISNQADLKSSEIKMPLVHPCTREIDPALDARVFKNAFCDPMLGEPHITRLVHRIKRSAQEFAYKRWGG